MKKRIISLICLALIISFSMSSCSFLPSLDGDEGAICKKHADKNDDGICDTVGCGKPYTDGCDRHRDSDDDGICDTADCFAAYTDGNEMPNIDSEITCGGTHLDADGDGKCDECGNSYLGGGAAYTLSVGVFRGTSYDLSDAVSSVIKLDGAVWESACDSVVSVSDGKIRAEKCGKTLVTVTDSDGNVCEITVKVSVFVNDTGFDISGVNDKETYKVKSEYEANRLLDEAIFNHTSELKLDFSSFGSSYVAFNEFDIEYELSNHVSITKSYYENTPHLLSLKITYNSDAASAFTQKTEANTYLTPINGNFYLRQELTDGKRADDFDGFAIYKNNSGKRSVRNSEELWWALEHNYLPTFSGEYTAAEKYFEEAKTILREIIREGMTDYEKLLAIYEYLICAVEYDYDAYNNMNTESASKDMCYYLEGVFERGRAVCDGKSKAFVLLCRIEGIECVRDFGSGKGSDGVGHAWNYVKLGGEWYLVDTTEGDAKQLSTSGIGKFFGCGVEYTSYEPFLTRVSYHKAKYDYSSVHTQISGSVGSKFTEDVLSEGPEGELFDYNITSNAELECLVRAILGSDASDDVIFILTIDSQVAWNLVIDAVIEDLSAEAQYTAFKSNSGTSDVNYLIFKSL